MLEPWATAGIPVTLALAEEAGRVGLGEGGWQQGTGEQNLDFLVLPWCTCFNSNNNANANIILSK